MSGEWLDGSDWFAAFTNSGISTSDKAQSFISIHHICRTRYMQQISVAALYMLMRTACDHYVDKCDNIFVNYVTSITILPFLYPSFYLAGCYKCTMNCRVSHAYRFLLLCVM